MSANIDHLMQNVYSYFLDLYHQNSGTPTNTTFLSFDAAGPNITPNMFKLHASDSAYSSALAVEQFSDLTNVIPAIDADIFRHTGKHIDEFYDMLLEGAFPATQDSNEITLFGALKSQAKKKFDELKIGSSIPNKILQFHPAYAMPNDWYDASVTDNWTDYQSSMSDQQQTGETPPLIEPPILLKQSWRWQVLPVNLKSVLQDSAVLERISTLHAVDLDQEAVHFRVSPNHSGAILNRTVGETTQLKLDAQLGNVLKVNLTDSVGQRLLARNLSPMVQSNSQAAARSMLSQVAIRADLGTIASTVTRISETSPIEQIVNDPNAGATPGIQSIGMTQAIDISSPVVQTIRLSELLKETSEQSVVSSNLAFSFKYCMVMIDRPWLSQAYLATQGWYVPGYSPGGFSTGTVSANTGIFPALPITFILVKDLQISGWSDEESETVERAAGLGPFSLIERTVDHQSKTLTKSGMQIIGWICQSMPLLPPAAAPTP